MSKQMKVLLLIAPTSIVLVGDPETNITQTNRPLLIFSVQSVEMFVMSGIETLTNVAT